MKTRKMVDKEVLSEDSKGSGRFLREDFNGFERIFQLELSARCAPPGEAFIGRLSDFELNLENRI